jgi:hypothetical protein
MRKFLFWMKDERGGIAAMTAIMLAAIVGLLALVVDLGHLQNVKNELQNAADAAALAGARTLMPLSGTGNPPWPMENPPPCTTATQAAMDTSVRNQANLKNISLDPAEVITGNWDFKPVGTRTGTFTPMACGSETNAVKVTARMRGDLPQGPVTMTFAKIFGFNTVNPFATAIAAIGYLDTLPTGSPGGFIGANEDFMDTIRRDNPDATPEHPAGPYYIILQAAGGQVDWKYADNGGWVGPEGTVPNTPYLRGVINDGTTFDMDAGETQATLSNGANASVIMAIDNKIQSEGGNWNIVIPSFDDNSWTPDEPQTIQNLWSIDVTAAWKPGDKLPDEDLSLLRSLTDDQGKLLQSVSIIRFKYGGLYTDPGQTGGTPSNTYSINVVLVH